jgi:hypothetical protein
MAKRSWFKRLKTRARTCSPEARVTTSSTAATRPTGSRAGGATTSSSAVWVRTTYGAIEATTCSSSSREIVRKILDFNDQGIDTIDLTAFATDFNSLQISQDGDDAVVDIPDFQRIRLVDFLFSDLKEDDFRF